MNKLLLKEQLILESSKKFIDEAIDIILESIKDNPSPSFEWEVKNEPVTFEWDVINDKLDKSLKDISNSSQALKYLNILFDKIKNIPTGLKLKISKYVIGILFVAVGYNGIMSLVNEKVPEIKKEIEIFVNNKKEKPQEYARPTNYSDSLVEFLKNEEGIGGKPVLAAYDLGDGAKTIGYGHAIFRNPNRGDTGGNYSFLPKYHKITPGKTKITEKQAEILLRDDINLAKNHIDDILNDWEGEGIKPKITQSMYDAMISMVYNMGRSKFRNSDFIQFVKKGDFKTASDFIKKIDAPRLIKKFPGLEPRREKEKNLFLADIETINTISESYKSRLQKLAGII